MVGTWMVWAIGVKKFCKKSAGELTSECSHEHALIMVQAHSFVNCNVFISEITSVIFLEIERPYRSSCLAEAVVKSAGLFKYLVGFHLKNFY
jgi:hypothetical protein